MSRSKHIDIVCVIAAVTALLISSILLFGENLGLFTVDEEIEGTAYFSSSDLNGDWDTSSATKITLNGTTGTVTGNGAYIYDGSLYIVYNGYYVITGEFNGSIIIDADGNDDIYIGLNGVSVTSEDTAALIVESADNVYITLMEGTENYISDGSTYSEDAEEDGINAAVFAHDDLTINGTGTLTVTGNYRHGITAKDDFIVTGGTIYINAAEDGIHANDSVRIADADITIDAGDDGITVSNDDGSDYIYIESGTVTINECYEGMEADTITINGGDITIYPTDDGLNAVGNTGEGIIVNGGSITVINETGSDADGFDSNSSITINDGYVFISVPSNGSCALDYGSENNGELLLNGGTVIASGSSMMLEDVSESSTQGYILYTGNNDSEGSVAVSDTSGNVLLTIELPQSYSALILSCPEMTDGETYTLTSGSSSVTVTAGENSTGSFGMGGMDMGNRGNNGDNPMADIGSMTDEELEDIKDNMDSMMQNREDMQEGMNPFSEDGEMGMPGEGMPAMNMPESDSEAFEEGQMPQMGMPDENGSTFENGQMPQNEDNQGAPEMPETDSENTEGEQRPDDLTIPDDSEMPDMNNRSDEGMGMGEPDMSGQQNLAEEITVSTDTWIILGVSAGVLLLGILIAWRYKGKN